ncbi:collagen, type XVII, alpha 1a [Conger conger]|uniref:collagen, type XVII, alpha 1a n=1 Tax=Conger conger TaxID=82655 RepID=UPI002A5A75FB|nr:collagen, type XVII, alpha 1a [Conger conger]
MDNLTAKKTVTGGSSGATGTVTETVTTTSRLTSLPPKGATTTVSSLKPTSSESSGGAVLVEKKIISVSSSGSSSATSKGATTTVSSLKPTSSESSGGAVLVEKKIISVSSSSSSSATSKGATTSVSSEKPAFSESSGGAVLVEKKIISVSSSGSSSATSKGATTTVSSEKPASSESSGGAVLVEKKIISVSSSGSSFATSTSGALSLGVSTGSGEGGAGPAGLLTIGSGGGSAIRGSAVGGSTVGASTVTGSAGGVSGGGSSSRRGSAGLVSVISTAGVSSGGMSGRRGSKGGLVSSSAAMTTVSTSSSAVSSLWSSGGVAADAGTRAVTMTTATKEGYSSGGSAGTKRSHGSSALPTYSPVSTERKMIINRSGGYAESSSETSSPEYTRKEYASVSSRGRTQTRESEIRARLQSASPSTRWTELDDVKRLLKGSRSCSISPPRSPTNTLPIPKKKATLERVTSEGSQSAQYEASELQSFLWANSGAGYGYGNANNMYGGTSVQGVPNNLALGGLGGTVPVYGVQNNLSTTNTNVLTANGINANAISGYQKNIAPAMNGPTINAVGVSTVAAAAPRSPASDDVFLKDLKFRMEDKENVPAKKESDVLVSAIDSDKFCSARTSDPLKKDRKVFGSTDGPLSAADTAFYTEKAPVKDKATYTKIEDERDKEDGLGGLCGGGSCCSWWKWLLGLLLTLLLLLGLLIGLIALAEEVKNLKARVAALEGVSGSAQSSRQEAGINFINPRDSSYVHSSMARTGSTNELGAPPTTDSLQKAVQQVLRSELQSDTFRAQLSVKGDRGEPGPKGKVMLEVLDQQESKATLVYQVHKVLLVPSDTPGRTGPEDQRGVQGNMGQMVLQGRGAERALQDPGESQDPQGLERRVTKAILVTLGFKAHRDLQVQWDPKAMEVHRVFQAHLVPQVYKVSVETTGLKDQKENQELLAHLEPKVKLERRGPVVLQVNQAKGGNQGHLVKKDQKDLRGIKGSLDCREPGDRRGLQETAGLQVNLDFKGHQVYQETQAWLDPKVNVVKMEKVVQVQSALAGCPSLGLLALLVPLALLDLQGCQVPLALQDFLVSLVLREPLVRKERRGLAVTKETEETEETGARRGSPAPSGKLWTHLQHPNMRPQNMAAQEQQDPQEPQGLPVLQAFLGPLDLQAHLGLLEPMALREEVQLAHQVNLANQVQQVQQVQQVHQAHLAQEVPQDSRESGCPECQAPRVKEGSREALCQTKEGSLLGLQAPAELLELRAQKDNGVKEDMTESQASLVYQGVLEVLGVPDLLEKLEEDSQARMDSQDHLVSQAHKVPQDYLDPQGCQELQDPKGHRAPLVKPGSLVHRESLDLHRVSNCLHFTHFKKY